MKSILPLFLQVFFFFFCNSSRYRKPSVIKEIRQSQKFDNPNFIRDRFKNEIDKPQMPDIFKERHRKPYNPAWMDYCDPYHCNDYHKIACGLNRSTMRFKWFQSVCHVILNNQCAAYRGALKFDLVDTKFCTLYVMYLRTNCPTACEAGDEEPVCGIRANSNDVVLFQSRCAMDKVNCKGDMPEFEETDMYFCETL